jgi:hypothetical protein
MRPGAQDWVASAPEKTILGVSGHLGWILEMPEFRKYITKYPMFDQALELFLDRASIDPASETGRVSLYILDIPKESASMQSFNDLRGMALIQIAGFRDTKAIQRVVVETFSPEGSFRIGGREYPLFVVMDINEVRIRVFFDNDGRLWIGDLFALAEIAKKRSVGADSPVSSASEWIPVTGAIQGFAQPELAPKHALKDFDKLIPTGIKGLTWAVTPFENNGQALNFDLCVTGTEEAVAKLKPWLQRLVAIASALAGDGMMPPETIQENNRMGVRCQFRQDQLETALKMIKMEELIQLPKISKLPKSGAPK